MIRGGAKGRTAAGGKKQKGEKMSRQLNHNTEAEFKKMKRASKSIRFGLKDRKNKGVRMNRVHFPPCYPFLYLFVPLTVGRKGLRVYVCVRS